MPESRNIAAALRKLCLSFPNTEQVSSHGHPNFKADGKSFAMSCVNHHGDMRVGLWLHSPQGDQQLYKSLNPEIYFVPPYVGPKGWLGIDLNKVSDWNEVISRVREAYENVASPASISKIADAIPNHPPTQKMSPQEINPMLADRPQELLAQLDQRCTQLPETSKAQQFGNPVWKAGKKTFVSAHFHQSRLQLQFWVGIEMQSILVADKRFSIPAYMGHNGWINLDIEDWVNWQEAEGLLLSSYRHFALKRMLAAMQN